MIARSLKYGIIIALTSMALSSCGSPQAVQGASKSPNNSQAEATGVSSNISSEDLAKLRAWQPGSTTGNKDWILSKY